jgi:hypothetical protein
MVSPEFTEVAASTTFKLRIVPEILRFTETDEWRQLLSKYLGAG